MLVGTTWSPEVAILKNPPSDGLSSFTFTRDTWPPLAPGLENLEVVLSCRVPYWQDL